MIDLATTVERLAEQKNKTTVAAELKSWEDPDDDIIFRNEGDGPAKDSQPHGKQPVCTGAAGDRPGFNCRKPGAVKGPKPVVSLAQVSYPFPLVPQFLN
jgi:hypothetical protein